MNEFNKLYFSRVVEKTRGLFTSSPRKLLLTKLQYFEYMYIRTNHVEMDTSKLRNKSIMSSKYIYTNLLERERERVGVGRYRYGHGRLVHLGHCPS